MAAASPPGSVAPRVGRQIQVLEPQGQATPLMGPVMEVVDLAPLAQGADQRQVEAGQLLAGGSVGALDQDAVRRKAVIAGGIDGGVTGVDIDRR